MIEQWPQSKLKSLAKSYRVYQKKEGLAAAVSGLFRREYRLVEAVRGIDLTVEQGEFVAFLGPNGAGKTTTLKLLSGVITPTAGTARVLGFVPWRRENAYRRRFALVMGQKNQLWWDLPAAESFRLHQHIYRIELENFERTLRRTERNAGGGEFALPAGPRTVAGRTDEDGTDRRAFALARGAVPRRADHRPGRGGPAQHPGFFARVSSSAARLPFC